MKNLVMILGTLLFSASFCAFAAAPAAPAKTLQEIHGAAWPKSVDGNVTKNQCMKAMGIMKNSAHRRIFGTQSSQISFRRRELRRLP